MELLVLHTPYNIWMRILYREKRSRQPHSIGSKRRFNRLTDRATRLKRDRISDLCDPQIEVSEALIHSLICDPVSATFEVAYSRAINVVHGQPPCRLWLSLQSPDPLVPAGGVSEVLPH